MALAASFQAGVLPFAVQYSRTSNALADSHIRVFTGNRILRNGDDPASLSTATGLRTQTSTLRSALVNGARATSFLQIASDGLAQIRAALTTLNGLTAQANEPGQTALSYAMLDGHLQSTLREIDRIVAATRFNNAGILDGSASGAGAPVVYVSDSVGNGISLDLPDMSTSSLFGGGISVGNAADATAASPSVNSAGDMVDEAIATVDAYQQRIDRAGDNVRRTIYGLNQGIDNLTKTDTGAEMRSSSRNLLLQQVSIVLLAQTAAVSSGLLGLVTKA